MKPLTCSTCPNWDKEDVAMGYQARCRLHDSYEFPADGSGSCSMHGAPDGVVFIGRQPKVMRV